ncbi:hypothetical protein K438DRAFT_1572499 [Mycena galopus ATCC 62051]|nr:hypothetical protein K438DRAFT_1572499 [Mycena galopus ATCC 62051]
MDVDETSAPRRVPELWFEDGNLDIQAESTQFRVYRGVLAAKSPIFDDMLSFPQPSESETVEGCPLVRLSDSATEVNVFLRAIFDSEFFETHPSPTRIEYIIGILRLSHKYEVNYLRRRALVHLSSGFPDKLETGTEKSSWRITVNLPSATDTPPPPPPAPWISIIQLAREVDALWILPDAFYQLADVCSSGRDVLASIKPAVFNGRSAQLSDIDQALFINGYCAQIHTGASDVMQFLHEPNLIPGCTSPYSCMSARLAAIELVRRDRATPPLQADPLLLWCDADDDWGRLNDACETCIESLKRTHEEARQAFWDQLPEMYGLPGWNQLRQMKTAALGL